MALLADGLQAAPEGPGGDRRASHETRERVLDYILRHPGACIADVSAAFGCSHTTASYHLQGLAKRHLVVQRKEGRLVRHFGVGTETAQTLLVTLLEDPRREAIVERLLESTDWPVNQLARAVQVNHAFLMRTLRVMSDQGFAQLVRPRARYYVKATPALVEVVGARRALRAPAAEPSGDEASA